MKATSATAEENLGIALGAVLVGKYRIDAILGQGGMGVVARATHLHLNETVAIKFLRADIAGDHEANQRFLREAHSAWKLKNEHVARVLDVGSVDDGLPYLVMEYLEGIDLDGMLEQSQRVSPPLAVEFIVQACEGLAEAHALGIVHRDVKPSNFFVTWRPDGSPLVKLLDFGISKVVDSLDVSLTQTQSMLGTPAYMSPEQMRSARTVDARTDVWSLGAVLFELIEGVRPFEAESFSEMCVKVAVDPPAPFTVPVPPGLDAVIRRCLEKKPDARYANVAEVAGALAPFARDPHAAAAAVERIERRLQRPSVPNLRLEGGSAPVAAARTDATPLPYAPRKTTPWAGGGAVASAAAATPTPWVAPASSAAMVPPVEDLTQTAFTTRPSAPITTPKRIGRIAAIAVVVAGIAIAAIALTAGGGSASAPAPGPASGSAPPPNTAGSAAGVDPTVGTAIGTAEPVGATANRDPDVAPATGSDAATGVGPITGSGAAGAAAGSATGTDPVVDPTAGSTAVVPTAGTGATGTTSSGKRNGKRGGKRGGGKRGGGAGSDAEIYGTRK
ncbi:MAG: protein kinase [Myxococcales bacterium]|nr:protein kinase [Myxococcales bacterium]